MTTEQTEGQVRIAEKEQRPAAAFQVLFDSQKSGWLHASLLNQPETPLYQGGFIDPFDRLEVTAIRRQNQVVATAVFDIDPDSRDDLRRGGIGGDHVLTSLYRRYPEHELSEDGQQLIIGKNGKATGAIVRINETQIAVQMGGQAGSFEVSDKTPVNDLTVGINQFALLLQRYVGYTWQSIPELRDRQMSVTLDLPQIPQGAPETYYSTFEVVGKDFKTHHREVDIDTEIGGFQNVKDAVKGVLMDLTDPERSRGFGTQPFSNRFLLVTGPEGVGKSLFPKAIDTQLRKLFAGQNYEHYRLPINDMMQNYGPRAHLVVKSILDHARENEKDAVPTALHVDTLDALCPPDTQAAYMAYMQTAIPIIIALREFGQEIGPESHHILVVGESRTPRNDLPEGVQRTFRRTFELKPTKNDLLEALKIQVATTRSFAAKTGIDPFTPDIDKYLPGIIENPTGLTGRDIQQAIMRISDRNKASGRDPHEVGISASEIAGELVKMQLSKGLEARSVRHVGFHVGNGSNT